jgi:hypothetical protein
MKYNQIYTCKYHLKMVEMWHGFNKYVDNLEKITWLNVPTMFVGYVMYRNIVETPFEQV